MPVVDLSKVGLEGMESYSQRKLMDSQSEHMSMLARKGQQEIEQTDRMQGLADKAAQALSSLAQGKKSGLEQDGEGVDPDSVSYSDPLGAVGMTYILGGAPEEGKKFLEASSEISKRESDIKTDKVLTEQRRLENIIKGSNIVASRLGTAKNQAEWDAGLDELEASNTMEPENVAKLRKMGFDPDGALFFRDRAISAADQARLEFDQLKEQNDIEQEAGRASRENQRIALQAARDEEARRHNLAIEKVGGKKGSAAITPPNSDAMKSVRTTLRNMVFKNVPEDDPEVEAAATQAASRAQQLIDNNKAMSWDVAVRRAILEAQAAGAYGIEKGTTRWFSKNDPDKGSFKSDAIALPMPKSKSEMVKGKTYMTGRGLAIWNGQAFDPVE